jgi:protein SCO1/2
MQIARKQRRIVWLGTSLVILAAAGGALAYRYWGGADGAVALPDGATLEVAQLENLRPLPAFSLDRLGAPMTGTDLQGHWSFVFFGYTNCPDACPETLGILNHVQESLQAQGVEPPRIVFVSLDAQRDTPQLLHDYLAAFGAGTLGATGSDSQLHDLVSFFGVSYERKPGADKSTYTLDHTTNFFLITPDGRWLASFAPADDPDAVLQDTLTLLGLRL